MSSCAITKNNAYTMNAQEKNAQNGYHALLAQRLITENSKNKDANFKAIEKSRVKHNKYLNDLNHASHQKSKKGKKNTGEFNFY